MKAILLTSVFILFCLTRIGQNLKALDDKYGFREAKLGMPFSSFKNLELKSGDMDNFPNQKLYKVTNVDLHIGDYDLDGIDYWFYKDQLCTIEIAVSKDYSNQQGVLKVLETAYGKGIFKKGSFGQDYYVWEGEKVRMDYSMGDDIEPTGDIQITCKKFMSQQREDQRLIEKQKEQEILKAAKKL